MSLRNDLQRATELHVAPPSTRNTQLSSLSNATPGATGVQPCAANPRRCWGTDTTGDATDAQQGVRTACNSGPKLHVAHARECNTQLGALTAHRLVPDLIAAIDRCCTARGDEDRNRLALIEECTALPSHFYADALAHFAAEAERYERANRGGGVNLYSGGSGNPPRDFVLSQSPKTPPNV